MTSHKRYMQYRKDELYHYNHNHDPRTGRFTSAHFYTSASDIVSHVKDVETIYKSLPDKEKHFLVGDGELSKTFFNEGENVPAALSITKKRGKPVSFAVAYEDGNGEVSIATATDPSQRGQGYGTSGVRQIDDWFNANPSDNRKTLIWLARHDNNDSISIAKNFGYEFETENEWGGWHYYRKDREPVINDFTKAKSDVMKHASNDIQKMQIQPPKKADVKKRGGLSDDEAVSCIKLAVGLRKEARLYEPKITSDVVNAVKSSGGTMFGLEHRMKQPSSLAAKIGADAKEKHISFDEAAKQVKDVVRYTSLSDNEHFVETYRKTKSNLEKMGYTETRKKNYFKMFRDGEVKHKSLQCTYSDSKGRVFEMQYHTPESQAAKQLKLPLYEQRRRSGLSEKRKKELERQMEELGALVPYPKNIFDV